MLDNAILLAIFFAIVGQSTVIWRKMGNIETGIKNVRVEQTKVALSLEETKRKSCPFPVCPIFKRAIEEATPVRDMPGG